MASPVSPRGPRSAAGRPRFFTSFAGYERSWFRRDLIAGLTVGAILVPQALAYASIAGVSPIVGLYAAPVAFFPFSGWKDSFLGDLHAHGTDAVDFYTRKKTVTSRWFSSGQGTGPYFVES